MTVLERLHRMEHELEEMTTNLVQEIRVPFFRLDEFLKMLDACKEKYSRFTPSLSSIPIYCVKDSFEGWESAYVAKVVYRSGKEVFLKAEDTKTTDINDTYHKKEGLVKWLNSQMPQPICLESLREMCQNLGKTGERAELRASMCR